MARSGEIPRSIEHEYYPADVIFERAQSFLGGRKTNMGRAIAEHFGHRTSFFQEGDSVGDACKNALINIPDGEEVDVLRAAVPLLQTYIRDRWGSNHAFEDWARETVTKDRKELVHVNDLLNYGVHKKSLELHVYPNTATPTFALLPLLRSGFKDIAERLRTQQALLGVENITGRSPLVGRFASMLEGLGFRVERTKDGQVVLDAGGNGVCEMSKEEFLNRFL